MAAGVIFEEIECKAIINKVNVPGWYFRWTINPYRGCQHACVYCFARPTHQYLGYDSGRDFESRIVVKTNAAAVLEQQLRRPGWRRELIALGTACDPYQQAELKYSITRSIVEVLLRFQQPVHTLTKSPSITRDTGLWARIARVTDAQVAFSIPTLDETAWKKLEPGTARPIKRMKAMRKLADAGVPCGVMIAPIVPGITDSEAQLEDVIAAAADHGASFVSPNVLHLRPGTKEWFMPALREAYPHLTEKYARWYTGSYAPKQYTELVIARINELRERWGFSDGRRHEAPVRGQLSLGI